MERQSGRRLHSHFLPTSTVVGRLLLAWPRSRTAGVGVLLGTLGAVVLLGLYLLYVLASR